MSRFALLLLTVALLSACDRALSPAKNSGDTIVPETDGGSVGNGGDDLPIEMGSAWFLGNRAVRYCYEVSPDFGAERTEIEASLKSAIDDWTMYLGERGSIRNAPPIARRMVPMPSCDGSEDLAFYFGVRNSDVQRRIRRFLRPVAFAYRSSYDITRGWGRGFVFVEAAGKHSDGFPNWRRSGPLKAILLHEIGHVLGCGHVSGTIMDEQIAADLKRVMNADSTDEVRHAYARIDRLRLLLVPPGPLSFRVARGLDLYQVLAAPAQAFSPSMVGPPWLRSPRTEGNLAVGETARFVVNGRSVFVQGLREVSRHGNDVPVFKRAFVKDGEAKAVHLRTESITYHGLEGDDERQALLEYNGDSFQLRIITWQGQEPPRIIAEF